MSLWKLLTARWGTGSDETDEVRIDASTNSLQNVEYSHHEIHSGSTFCIHLANLLFAKAGETGILFKTPAGTKWLHLVYSVSVETKCTFDILEAPTVNTGAYPVAFYEPRNRNRNSDKESTILSIRAAPVVNQASIIVDGTATPISADGTVLHTEVIGGKRGKTASDGHSHTDEYILKADTVYYFRVVGDDTGTSNLGMSMELIWYEHTDKH